MGSGRNTGARVLRPSTHEKKVARAPDSAGVGPSRMGRVVSGGGRVEPPRPAPLAYLDSCPAAALDPTCARPSRPSAQGSGVLGAGTRRRIGHAPPLCGRASGQYGDAIVAGVADATVGGSRENGAAAGVGQGLVARQPGRAGVAQGAQPPRQAGRRLSHRGVPFAEQKSLAESHRAQRGAWQAGHCRTGSQVAC
jgi:hypothetical protein